MILKQNEYTFATLLEHMNKTYVKKSGASFKEVDVYKYIQNERLPRHFGDVEIIKTNQYGVNVYILKEN